jgi:hypothetical protein
VRTARSDDTALPEAFAAKYRQGKIRLPLPRRVRLRLWLSHLVNAAGIWLVRHDRVRLAEALWRGCGMWN